MNGIDASKLRLLKPFEQGGKFGLVVAVHGRDQATRYYDTAAERDAAMYELYDAWKSSRKITGSRADVGQKPP